MAFVAFVFTRGYLHVAQVAKPSAIDPRKEKPSGFVVEVNVALPKQRREMGYFDVTGAAPNLSAGVFVNPIKMAWVWLGYICIRFNQFLWGSGMDL